MRRLFLMTLGFFCCGVAAAMQVPALNAADVVVANNSSAVLQQALPKAFGQVLVKLSGNAAVMTLPTIQNALPQVNRYIESYSYSDSASNPLTLHVIFDLKAVKQLLENAGQAIWSSDRPLVLVWISVPVQSQSEVLSSDQLSNPVTQVIQQEAHSRGVPVLFPVMDLEDQSNVAQTTSAVPNAEQMQRIGQRYGTHAVLAAAVVPDSANGMQGEWQLFLNGLSYEWQSSGADVMQVVTNGINRVSDLMANQLGTLDTKGMQRVVTMRVSGVQNLNDYVHMIAELKKLTPVVDVAVSDMGSNAVLLKVKTIGDRDNLASALNSASGFVAESSPTSLGENAPDLFYHWGSAPTPNTTTTTDPHS